MEWGSYISIKEEEVSKEVPYLSPRYATIADVLPLPLLLLQMLPARYRSLAGVCCRVLRLDLLLLAGHQLQALGSVSHLCEEEDVMEVCV